jgi:hypothetical protein
MIREGDIYFPQKDFKGFSWSIWGLLSYLPFIAVGISLFFIKEQKDYIQRLFLLFSTTLLVWILLCVRIIPPLETLNIFIYQVFPMTLFRSPEKLFVFLPFLVVFLIYLGFSSRGNFFVSIFCGLILLIPMPFYLGGIQTELSSSFKKGENYKTAKYSFLVKVPTQYKSLKKILDNDNNDYKIQELPYSVINSVGWSQYPTWKLLGIDVIQYYYNKNINQANSFYNISYPWSVNALFNERDDSPDWFLNISALLNNKYLLYHKDVRDDFVKRSIKKIDELVELKKIIPITINNYFNFYRISDKYFLPHIYPAPGIICVPTKIETLIPLTLTQFFNTFPAFVFTELQVKDFIDCLLNLRQRVVDTQFLFPNNSFNDFAIDLAKIEIENRDRKLFSWFKSKNKIPISLKLDEKGEANLSVEYKSTYSFYIGYEDFNNLFSDSNFEVFVDGKKFNLPEGELINDARWIKLGELMLNKGKHNIEFKNSLLNKGKAEDILSSTTIIVTGKKELDEYRSIMLRNPIVHFFYIDREIINDMLNDSEGELRKNKINITSSPFKIGERQFYISENNNYSLMVFVKPKRSFIANDIIGIDNGLKVLPDLLLGWDISTLGTRYKQKVTDECMIIDPDFHSNKKEAVVLTKKFSNTSIKDNPYMVCLCKMADAKALQLEIEIKLGGIGLIDRMLGNDSLILSAENNQYITNIYEIIEKRFGKELAKNLSIDGVILRFKKKDDEKLIDYNKLKPYTFVFKGITFLKNQPILADFRSELPYYLPNLFYYFDGNRKINKVKFFEQIPSDIKSVYKLELYKKSPIIIENF